MKKTKSAGGLLFDLIMITFASIAIYLLINLIILFSYSLLSKMGNEPFDYNAILFENLNLMKALQGISSIIIFAVPAFYMYKKHAISMGKIGWFQTKPILFLWVILIFLVALPLIQYTGILNQNVHFPESLSHIENYFKTMESQAEILTKNLLKGSSWLDLMFNILIIAALPAICEELFFRGVLQKIFKLMFKSTHLSIWVTSFVFAVLHFQFYGIFPRFLIGLILGYTYTYGKNMWYNIFLHFINNASVVCVYFYLIRKNLPLDYADKEFDIPLFVYPICIALLVLTLSVFKTKTKITNSVKL